ncbi:MAG: hypothetical protein RL168_114, partial [Bacteroidota bacterium]
MKRIPAILALLVFAQVSVLAQEAPKSCCSDKKTEQSACAEKPAKTEAKACCAEKTAAKPAASCGEHGAAKPAASCGEHATAKTDASCGGHGASTGCEGGGKKASCAHGEGQVGKQCCGACQEGANKPQVITMHRVQGGQVHMGQTPMHRMHAMGEGTEMTIDTIVSGDSTKVMVKVIKRANLGQGQSLEDVMIHLDGVELPEGALAGEPHVFMFKGEGMGSDLVWNEAAPGAGNAFFSASNKAILGVKLEKRDDIKGAFVVEVIPTSTAAALGLKSGDIIVAVDGNTVFSEESMMAEMAPKLTGDPIEITYRRDGKKKKASGYLIATAPMMGMPMSGMVRGLPAMGQGEVEIITGGTAEAMGDNVEITEE